LEILELILSGSLTLLVVIDLLGYRLNWCISDRNQLGLLIFYFLLPLDVLFFLKNFFFKIRYAYLILYNFLNPFFGILLLLISSIL
jgi:hypothetical protein